jgi:hypothetical protein
MDNWPFDQGVNVAAFTLRRIIVGGGPILYVCHDLEDDGWQFLDGMNMTMEDAMLVSMGEIVKYDWTVTEIASMLPGYSARRKAVGGLWEITKVADSN